MLKLQYQHNGKACIACFSITNTGRLRQVSCRKSRHQIQGLGTAIKTVTTFVGVKPCAKCQQRAAQLDAATPGWVAGLFGLLRRVFP